MHPSNDLFEPWRSPVRGGLALYARRPGAWLGLSALAALASSLPQLASWLQFGAATGGTPSPGLALTAARAGYCLWPVTAVLSLAVGMVLTVAMAGALCGHPVAQVRMAVRHLGKRLPEVLAYGALVLAATIAAVVVLSVPIVALSAIASWQTRLGRLPAAGTLLAMVVTGVAYGRLAPSIEYVLLTRRGAWPSVLAAWRLTRGRTLRMLGYVAIAVLPPFLGVIAAPRLVRAVLGSTGAGSADGYGADLLLSGLLELVWLPYGNAVLLLAWLKLRGETEPIDAVRLARDISRSARQQWTVTDDPAVAPARGPAADPQPHRRRHRRRPR